MRRRCTRGSTSGGAISPRWSTRAISTFARRGTEELLAKSLIRIGRTRDGIAAFGRVLAIDPLKPETHLALARIYALERDPERARAHAELAARRDPAGGDEVLAELMMDAGRI